MLFCHKYIRIYFGRGIKKEKFSLIVNEPNHRVLKSPLRKYRTRLKFFSLNIINKAVSKPSVETIVPIRNKSNKTIVAVLAKQNVCFGCFSYTICREIEIFD
jgi:hypothetical protein